MVLLLVMLLLVLLLLLVLPGVRWTPGNRVCWRSFVRSCLHGKRVQESSGTLVKKFQPDLFSGFSWPPNNLVVVSIKSAYILRD